MNKKDIVAFFDSVAEFWDDSNVRNEEVIAEILQKSGIKKGAKVLDVACGTGVLFPDYMRLNVDFTGIDISENMVRKAKEKFPEADILCGDATCYSFNDKFDVIIIYNAFPHFDQADKLIDNLSRFLKASGRFTVAHGISEKELEECHSGKASKISVPLVKKEVLADMLKPYVDVDVLISDDRMYMVSGVNKQKNS